RSTRDWSSDVCSSDLRARVVGRARVRGVADAHCPLGPADREGRRGTARVAEVLVVIMALPYLGALWRLTWHLDAVGGGRAVGAEIGRASCRERVEVEQ